MAQRIEEDREYNHSDFVTGFTIGIFREIPLNTKIDFQLEICYNRMGGEANDSKTTLDYISLPALIKVHGNRLGWYVGPQLSLLLGGKTTSTAGGEEDLKDSYKSVDWGAITGFEYWFGKEKRFVVSARYQFSLNDVLKDGEPGESIRNTGAQLTAGFRF